LWREIAFNSSVLMLTGAFVIGMVTGEQGLEMISPFIVDPFRGVLCLFLLDMGLIAGRGLRGGAGKLPLSVIAFGLYMPVVGGLLAAGLAAADGTDGRKCCAVHHAGGVCVLYCGAGSHAACAA
jgi:hypothetical protein